MKKWKLRAAGDIPRARELAEKLHISELLLRILWSRGHRTEEEINKFLNARITALTPPGQWPLIPEAAQIFCDNILQKKRVAIWGDYDVDGITATALALDVLEAHGIEAGHYLPDRLKEGYGLNKEGLKKLADAGCEVILTVDCGISNNEQIEYARQLGMEVIVTDHHLPPESLPEALALVDTRMDTDRPWPCQQLAGVGLAFYFMGEVNKILSSHTGKKYIMDKALDLVALGTLADIMPVEGENRILVKGGMKTLSRPKRGGIKALKKTSGLSEEEALNTEQIVFRLAPRINAAGRMGHPELALKLLRSGYYDGLDLAKILEDYNIKRKKEEARILEEAREQALALAKGAASGGLVLAGKDWHAGVVGIVASKIVEEFNRPTIILYESEDDLKGSARSVDGFDMYAGLNNASALLKNFGGHKQAAGLCLKKSDLENFRKDFDKAVNMQLLGELPDQELTLDCELDFENASSHEFLRELNLLEPFGPGNEEPVFLSPPLEIVDRQLLGNSGEHVLLKLKDPSTNITLPAKAWRMAKEFPQSMVGQKIRLAYTPKIETFRGNESISLDIKDWRKI